MTWMLRLCLWIDRTLRRPCLMVLLVALTFLALALMGRDWAWPAAKACGCVGGGPILLMFLLAWAHNTRNWVRRRRRQ